MLEGQLKISHYLAKLKVQISDLVKREKWSEWRWWSCRGQESLLRFPRSADSRQSPLPPNEWPTAAPGVTHHQRPALVRSYWISKAQKPAQGPRTDPVWDLIQARSSSNKSKVYLVLVKCKGPGIVGSMMNPLDRKNRLNLEDFSLIHSLQSSLMVVLLTPPVHLSADVVPSGAIVASVQSCKPATLSIDDFSLIAPTGAFCMLSRASQLLNKKKKEEG